MILCIDMGNTTTYVGVFENNRLKFAERFQTRVDKTDLEYIFDLQKIFDVHGLLPSDLEGGILSSVVPNGRDILLRAVERFCHIRLKLVSYKLKRSFSIGLDHEEELGANLIALSEGAIHSVGAPAIILRTGTATTISVIDENNCYVGGLILPGMQAGMNALTEKTGLPKIQIKPSSIRLPKETLDAMNTGALFGNAGMIEGVLTRILSDYPKAKVLATGRQANILKDYMTIPVLFDETLVLKGLLHLYGENK